MEKNEIECCQEKHIHKNVIDFVDSESIDYMMQKENMNINKK